MSVDLDEHLWKLCTNYYFPRRLLIRTQKTKDQYRYAIGDFERVLGRPPNRHDLTDDGLTMMVADMLSRGLAEATINERVGRLKTLQTWLAKRGLVPTFPTLERLDVPEPAPIAWKWSELQRLFSAGRQEPGLLGGVLAGDWWFAWLNWLWNTSERYGASIALRWEMIDLESCIASVPAGIRKGRKKSAVYQLWPETAESLRKIIEPRRDMVFPWPHCEETYWNHYARILRRAGLPTGRKRKTQAMRVSHATWRKFVGHDPTRALLHTDPATTRKHYLDRSFEVHDQPRLPSPWMDDEPPRSR